MASINYGEIISKGKYYYPAGLHYDNNGTNVVCDRCQRTYLKCCVGYGNADLCMNCVQILVDTINPYVPREDEDMMTFMEQDMFRCTPSGQPRNIYTNMAQDMFLTRMHQDQMNP